LIVCIDPGTQCAGFATFSESDKGMLSCGVFRGKDWMDTAGRVPDFGQVAKLVIEDPRVYPITNVDPNNLMTLAKAVGAIVANVKALHTKLVTPSRWKKSVPKKIHQKRILRAMSQSETQLLENCLCPKSLQHNVVDAIGIGLWELRRMK